MSLARGALPGSCSGAIYTGVPTTTKVLCSGGAGESVDTATPKSISLTRSSSPERTWSIMFAGLRSRWRTPCLVGCAQRVPHHFHYSRDTGQLKATFIHFRSERYTVNVVHYEVAYSVGTFAKI